MPDADRRRRFHALFDAHRADVLAYCRWRAASAGDAEDALAEVFLIAWRRLDDVPAGDAGLVWLSATARRTIANQRRSRRRRVALAERLMAEPAQAQPGPEERGGEEEEEAALVREALGRLGARDREVLLPAEWHGLSAEEIAAVTGCLAVMARGRLHRARRRFRAAWDALLAGDDDPAGRLAPATDPEVRT